MRYTDSQIQIIFPSKKTYSDIADTYIELGLRRIPLFYEGVSARMEIPLIKTQSMINNYFDLTNVIPFDLIDYHNTLINHNLFELDKIYMVFMSLVDKASVNPQHKRELLSYIDYKDIESIKVVKRYLYEIS